MTARRRKTLALTFGAASVAVLALGACSSSSTSTPEASAASSAAGDLSGLDIETGGGEVGKAPSNWPSDVPYPKTLPFKGSGGFERAQTAAWLGDGDLNQIQSDLRSEFEEAGWSESATFGDGSSASGYVFSKGDEKVQVTVAEQNGQIAVSETIVTPPK